MIVINLGAVITLISIAGILFYWISMSKVPSKLQNIKEIPLVIIITRLASGATFIQVIDSVLHYFIEYGFCRAYFGGSWIVWNADPELFRKIAYDTSSFDKLTPHCFSPNSLLDNMMGINIVQSSRKEWKKYRKVVNPSFKKGWKLDVLTDCIEEFFVKLGDGNAYGADVEDLIQRVIIESLGREIMDLKFDTILADKKHKFISYFNDIMNEAINPSWYIFPSLDNPWNPFRYNSYRKLDYVNGYFNKVLQERKKKIAEDETKEYNDILSLMLASNINDPKGLSDDEIRHNTLIFFLAGQDTTSLSICAALHLLAEHPEIQEIMRKEVLAVLGKDEYENGKLQIPTNEHLSKLEYTYAVVKETMRLYPAVTVINHRVALKDIQHKGQIIPKQTLVHTVIYAIHRNPKYFKNPNEFIPSRFLKGNIDTAKFESNWFPFSSGSRSCIGASFSIIEQKLVLAYIIRRYKIRPVDNLPGKRPLKVQRHHLLRTDNLRLNFELI
jgi:cytochrome P450